MKKPSLIIALILLISSFSLTMVGCRNVGGIEFGEYIYTGGQIFVQVTNNYRTARSFSMFINFYDGDTIFHSEVVNDNTRPDSLILNGRETRVWAPLVGVRSSYYERATHVTFHAENIVPAPRAIRNIAFSDITFCEENSRERISVQVTNNQGILLSGITFVVIAYDSNGTMVAGAVGGILSAFGFFDAGETMTFVARSHDDVELFENNDIVIYVMHIVEAQSWD